MFEVNAAGLRGFVDAEERFDFREVIRIASAVGIETGDDAIRSAHAFESSTRLVHPNFPGQADAGMFSG